MNNIDLNNSYATETFGESFNGDVNSRGSEEGDPHGYTDTDSLFDRNADDDVEGDADADTETEICESQANLNDGIDSFESLKKSFEMKLAVGTEIDILYAVHKLYCDYAAVMGFSVRKGNQEYFNPPDDVRMKMYHCSCAGTADNKSSKGRIAAYKKQSYRSNCEAKLRVVRDDIEAPWRITLFVKQHNHELVNHRQTYLLRSARNMSRQKKRLLISMRASGIGVSKAYRFLEDEAGGRENIGFIRKDVYNALNSENRNMSKVDNGDANKLLDILTDRGMSDPSFFWKVKLSDDGRLENLFFRDTRCLIDYQHFGDVLSVDATYKTNKYDLICVPLIGINHHRTNVMFGLGFLSNEKTESYEWLFSTFLQAMYHKEPAIVFSDQDMAIMNAVDYTFRQASRRLCQWHINKNAVKHFGKLNQDKHFKNLWYKCMNGCESEDQFDSCWTRMIEEHNLSENKWFCTTHNLRSVGLLHSLAINFLEVYTPRLEVK